MDSENLGKEDIPDRVRSSTSEHVQARLDREIERHIAAYAGRSNADITKRIKELDHEWDVERLLELNASSLAFIGTVLGATINRKWLLLPATVLAFLFQHAIQGWCPPVTLFRRLGVRSSKEIDVEKYALKFIRGDFGTTPEGPDTAARATRAAAL
ncbi:hypothetical protein [Pseudarthrobacter oxydans]|uniref:hypothetical protein n=1 Tax=Pseudarthrobacter oxydans TaxID=1671 RepID=UPI00381BD7AC